MLVLERKLGQTIHIGENITLTVVRMNERSVWIGIEAPREVNIARSEVLNRRPKRDQPK